MIISAPNAAPSGTADGTASDRRSDGKPGCRIERLSAWTTGRVTWLGECHEGFAHGRGVLLNVVEGGELERFYGRVQLGHLSMGVLRTSGGYVAGTWARGVLTEAPADDVTQRNALIEAFRAASSAAMAVSKSFARKADAKLSRFYAKQAHLLRSQMD
jgi:hypothetical protein